MNIVFSLKNNEQILLRADDFNYELCQLKSRKDETTGEVSMQWTPFKYFASLSAALNRLADMKVRQSDAQTLKQLAKDIEAARAEIMAAWSTGADVDGGCQCKG